jgi:hypothetical protein
MQIGSARNARAGFSIIARVPEGPGVIALSAVRLFPGSHRFQNGEDAESAALRFGSIATVNFADLAQLRAKAPPPQPRSDQSAEFAELRLLTSVVSLDHIIPMARGGSHTKSNAQCSHLICNSLKQDKGGGQLKLGY